MVVVQQNNKAVTNTEDDVNSLAKQEIQVMKYQTLLRCGSGTSNSSLAIRVIKKYEALCQGKPLANKLQFVSYSLRWLSKKLIRKPITVIENAVLRIAIVCTGGVGDLVNSAAFLNKFYQSYSLPTADFFYQNPQSFQAVFAKATFVNNIFHEDLLPSKREFYNIILYVRDHVTFEFNLYESQLAEVKDLLNAVATASRKAKHLQSYVIHHPNLDGHYADEVVLKGLNRVTAPGLFANIHIDEDKDLVIYPDLSQVDNHLIKYGLHKEQFITIHDGFDNETDINVKTSTKQWNLSYWEEVIAVLKKDYSYYKIIQLGARNSRIIPATDLCLVGKTTLPEVISLLSQTRLHIDSESGLVRIARALGKQSIVLFGPTNPDYYGLKHNINIAPTICGNCFWTTADWMSRCPRGFAVPLCMSSVKPNQVISAIETVLQ